MAAECRQIDIFAELITQYGCDRHTTKPVSDQLYVLLSVTYIQIVCLLHVRHQFCHLTSIAVMYVCTCEAYHVPIVQGLLWVTFNCPCQMICFLLFT